MFNTHLLMSHNGLTGDRLKISFSLTGKLNLKSHVVSIINPFTSGFNMHIPLDERD